MSGSYPVSSPVGSVREPSSDQIANWQAAECVACGIFWALALIWLVVVAISALLPSKPGFLIVSVWFLITLGVRAIQRFYGAKLESTER